jgi:hypothetical protein
MKSSKGLDENDIAFFQDLDAAKARHSEELESFRQQAMRIESLREEDGLLPPKTVATPITVGIKIQGKHLSSLACLSLRLTEISLSEQRSAMPSRGERAGAVTRRSIAAAAAAAAAAAVVVNLLLSLVEESS